MKNNTNVKSSVTLPPDELKLVTQLKKKLGAKSNVEVIRKGLYLLRDQIEMAYLKEAFRKASDATRERLKKERIELDGTSSDGID